MEMDSIDMMIVELLKNNSKLNTKEIAAEVGLTTTPAFERIKRLERSGVIKGYQAIIDKKKIGKGLQVVCRVSLKGHHLDDINSFEEAIILLEEVQSCYHIAGDFDYSLFIEVKDIEAYHHFLKYDLASIPNIDHVQSSFVLNCLKE